MKWRSWLLSNKGAHAVNGNMQSPSQDGSNNRNYFHIIAGDPSPLALIPRNRQIKDRIKGILTKSLNQNPLWTNPKRKKPTPKQVCPHTTQRKATTQ